MQSLTLFELNNLIKRTLDEIMFDYFWVTAEISDFSVRGHCYLEFIQKDISGNSLVAKARGTIWKSTYEKLSRKFQTETGQPLRSGMKVMVYTKVSFHELYGFALNIIDIDPTYTLGDLAKRRQEILNQLREEGILELQKELEIPVLCQRIAVISSASAAGYGDFCNQLQNNDSGLKFYTKLFPAIMQGDQVEPTIIEALDAIVKEEENWDVVVIIRGGGATADMSGFDTLALAENVVQFPLPIITGIGHERDDTVLDLISNIRVKTPTAAAEFLIHHLEETAYDVQDMEQRITASVRQILNDEHNRIDRLTGKLPSLFAVLKNDEMFRMERIMKRIGSAWQIWRTSEQQKLDNRMPQLKMLIDSMMQNEKFRLQLLDEKIKNADPEILLKRGYSLTYHNGRVVTSKKQLNKNDQVEIHLADGIVNGVISD